MMSHDEIFKEPSWRGKPPSLYQGDGLPMISLPLDYTRTAFQRIHIQTHTLTLPSDVLEAIHVFCQVEKVSIPTTLLTALCSLLFRYSGQQVVNIGIGKIEEDEDIHPGTVHDMALSTWIRLLRIALSGAHTFSHVLKQIHEDVTGMEMENSRVESDGLNDYVQSMYQILFFLPTSVSIQSGIQSVVSLTETYPFDLAFTYQEDEQGCEVSVAYNAELFEKTTIHRLFGHLQALLNMMIANSQMSLSEFSLLNRQEYQRQVVEWNRTERIYIQHVELSSFIPGQPYSLLESLSTHPTDSIAAHTLLRGHERHLLCIEQQNGECDYLQDILLHELFDLQVACTPDAIAVMYEDSCLTYNALAQSANQLARYLQSRGINSDQLVGVCLDRSLEMIISLLGILKAGGAYMPLDPEYPEERLAFMFDNAQAPVLLTQQHLVHKFSAIGAEVLSLDSQWSVVAQEWSEPTSSSAREDTLAYVIYTSGSTGVPKGVMNTHRGICNRLLWMQDAYHLTSSDRVIQKTSSSFDVSVWEFFWPLITGACLVFAQPAGHRDPGYLVHLIVERQITTVHFVPSMLHVFLTHPNVSTCRSLQRVICSGEALTYELQERFFTLLNAHLNNLYGPTEAAIDVTAWECERNEHNQRVPIGRPIANLQTYILDQYLHPVPIGVPGELHIGGVGLARGYLRQPALTSERFIPHPFASMPGERLYKTGDLARYHLDGTIEFLGRLDSQVKLHGHRIELGEIEAVLLQHSLVHEAVVVRREDIAGDVRLVAYVVASLSTAELTSEQLQRLIRRRLPEYMVPSRIIFLAAMPLTTSGKIDRRALPAPEQQDNPQKGQYFVPPGDALEHFLVDCWKKALPGQQHISVNDNFFELGGNSIKAALLINSVQKRLKSLIHVVAVFDAPTIVELAAYLRNHYAREVAREFGEPILQSLHPARKIGTSQIATFRSLIPQMPEPEAKQEGRPEKNPRAIFILSPPRSGTTLMRVMLGGNPKLFSPPDLELLSFNTLQERKSAFRVRDSSWLEGTIRAIMEIRHCDADVAKRLMEQFEEQNLTVSQFYSVLQEWIGEKILVDKSVEYALDIETLRRAEKYFADAYYIHLVRHPYGMIQSMEEVHLDQVFFRYEHSFTPRELAELVWLVCHQNILQFLQEVPSHRQHRVYFEDLVKQPESMIRQLCAFLNIEFHQDMLEPHKGRRMTDGIYAPSRMLGDMKFHEHKRIDSEVADRWKNQYTEDFLGDSTWQLARSLGYPSPVSSNSRTSKEQRGSPVTSTEFIPIRPIERETGIVLPLSFAQRQLWFLDQLHPDNPFYIMSMAFHLHGELNIAALERSIREVVRRHEVLRTLLTTVHSIPVQIITEAEWHMTFVMPLIDLSIFSKEKSEKIAQHLMREEAQRPFRLAHDLMLRATLIQLKSQEYVLLLTLHHVAADGWSLDVLQSELSLLYKAFSSNQPSPLPELPFQYADYAIWQRQSWSEAVMQQQLHYWTQQLFELPTLDLPTDYPRQSTETFRGAHHLFELSQELLAQLKDLSQREGATLFMTLCAAFQVLLSRYSGQHDIAIGTSIAYRQQRELEGLIGFLMNTLVLRSDLSTDPTFEEFLREVRKTALMAYMHQDVPFEKVVSAVQPERDLSHGTLYQVLFQLQQQNQQQLNLPGVSIRSIDVDNQTTKCDLFLNLVELPNGLKGRIEYNTDLFSQERIRNMSKHFQQVLEAVAAHPKQRISYIPVLGKDESQRLLVEWNATYTDYPRTSLIQEKYEEQVERRPDAIALVWGEEQFTYARLNQRANQLAHMLRQRGVGPDVCVGIYLDPTPSLIITLLAILKAGGAYLPLDSSSPSERLAFMLQDVNVPVLVTQKYFVSTFAQQEKIQIICLDHDEEERAISLQSMSNPRQVATPHNLACVIYTSGSTGVPKGVGITHQAVLRLLFETNYITLQTDDIIAQVSTIAFDAATFEIWGALAHGARLVMVEKEVMLSPYHLTQQLRREQVSTLLLTPAVFNLTAQQVPDAFLSLRQLLVGGEALDPHWIKEVLKSGAPKRLLNVYGPTEGTTIASWYLIQQVMEDVTSVPIGAALANSQLYVLDANLQPVPTGIPGELFIGGDGLARGYLNRPALTAEKFIPHPFSSKSGQRLYRTGDIVRWRGDGHLEFLGRRDAQVKIRGLRIELSEIETFLSRHPGVRQAVVLVKEKQLIAYVARHLDENEQISSSVLQQYLRIHIPDYMVPGVFIFLQELPLNRNGKVDRRALPPPDQFLSKLRQEYVVPRNKIEQTLANIWRQILKVDQISVYDNFFTLGGDSILSIQVVAKAQQAGVQLTSRQIFQYPTIAELTQAAGTTSALSAEQELVSGTVPLTPIQHWFFAQQFPTPHHFNQAFMLHLRRKVQPGIVMEALYHLMQHHDALRMRFRQSSKREWHQYNASIEALEFIPFNQVDLSYLPVHKQDVSLNATAHQVQVGLDLSHGPLLRAVYITAKNDQENYLLLVIHHLVVDGVSWRVLLEDIERVCEQIERKQMVQFPPKTMSFRQWSLHLAHHARHTELERALEYWQTEIRRPSSPIPVDFPVAHLEQQNTIAQAQTVTISLGKQATQALLHHLPSVYRVQINDVLLTSLAQVLTAWMQAPGVLITLEGHGREEVFASVDLSRTVGWFTSIFPVYLDMTGVVSSIEALEAGKEQLRRIPDRGVSYGILRYLHAKGQAKLQALPSPQISFNYLGQFDQIFSQSSLFAPASATEVLSISTSPNSPRTHLLQVNSQIFHDCLIIKWTYSKGLHQRATIERLADTYLAALDALISSSQISKVTDYTPADFPQAKLSKDQLDTLFSKISQKDRKVSQ